MNTPVIIWFRQDLRLSDNPALSAALETERPVIALYIDDSGQTPALGGASGWWLHHSLTALNNALRKCGASLILRHGDPLDVLQNIMKTTGADAVYLNRCYEPYAVARDSAIKSQMENYHSFKANLLFEPWEIKTNDGNPCRIFTPFWKKAMERYMSQEPLQAPKKLNGYKNIESDDLNDWQLLPTKPDWAGGLRDTWQPGENNAQQQLREFLKDDLQGYASARDFPAKNQTSHLSPYLHFGEISPRQIFYALEVVTAQNYMLQSDANKFKAELGWREFSYHLLFHFPDLPSQPLQEKLKTYPWRVDKDHQRAWQRGQTGYPIVDAGMRELWATGYMHNRVRMITASFLIKNLLQPWQDGEGWFWDTLVDADLANNSASWQWVAGSGADAAPYFRIFNPVLQGERFDAKGDYIRRWVPELSALPDKYIHKPFAAPAAVLEQAGITLGNDYPQPIVDFRESRDRALKAFKTLKTSGDDL